MLAVLLGAFLLIAADNPSTAPDSPPQAACASSRQEFRHKGELPVADLRMIEQIATMADTNEPFQITDAIVGKALPFYRFIHASQVGCKLDVLYEQGGRGHGSGSISFTQAGNGWVVDDANIHLAV